MMCFIVQSFTYFTNGNFFLPKFEQCFLFGLVALITMFQNMNMSLSKIFVPTVSYRDEGPIH